MHFGNEFDSEIQMHWGVMGPIPDEVEGISEAALSFLRVLNADLEKKEMVDSLREVHEETYEAYVFGDSTLKDSHLQWVADYTRSIHASGELGVSLLLATLVYMITAMRADLRERAETFLVLQKDAVDEILGSGIWKEDRRVCNAMLAVDLNPPVVVLLRRASRVVELLRRAWAALGSLSARISGRGTPAEHPSLSEYRRVIGSPLIRFLRKCLDAHGSEESTEVDWGLTHIRCSADLEVIDSEYLDSPFVPLNVQPTAWGGQLVTLLFCDRPTQLFRAWVYGGDPDQYQLRSFGVLGAAEDAVASLVQNKMVQKVLSDRSLMV